jgi:hypothetical protein
LGKLERNSLKRKSPELPKSTGVVDEQRDTWSVDIYFGEKPLREKVELVKLKLPKAEVRKSI